MKLQKGPARRPNGQFASLRERLAIIPIMVVFLLISAYFYDQGTPEPELLIQPPVVQAVESVVKPADLGLPPVQQTEHQQILHYIVEKFGDRANDAIAMLSTCENHKLDPNIINKGNTNGTWDVGVFQINVDPKNTQEVEHLKDWKYNIDRAYDKYHSKGDTFYHWTCGWVVKDRTYLDAIRGK